MGTPLRTPIPWAVPTPRCSSLWPPRDPENYNSHPPCGPTAGDTVTPQASDREQILGCCLMVPRVILLAVRMEVPVGWDGGGREVGTKGLHLPPPAPWGWQGEGEGSQGEGVNALLPCCCHLPGTGCENQPPLSPPEELTHCTNLLT